MILPDPFDAEPLNRLLSSVPVERRRFPRQVVAGMARLVPITAEGLDQARARSVTTCDLSRGGVSLRLDEPPVGPRWAVVFDAPDHPMAIEISLRDLRRVAEGGFRIGCQFIDRLESAA